MKHAIPALLLLANLPTAQAQLVNGSFEIDGQPSLEGWHNTCGGAVLLPGGAPGAGDWHVGYPTMTFGDGSEPNCDIAPFDLLFQELPTTSLSTQQVTVGFWSRTGTEENNLYFLAATWHTGWSVDGVNEPMNTGGTGTWSAPSIEWTYHVQEGYFIPFEPQQPRTIGFGGYDTSATGMVEFDGIEILSLEELSTSINTVDPAKVLGYYDPTNEAIVISKPLEGTLLCFDAAGRSVEVSLTGARDGSRTFGTASLAPGIYTAVSGTRSLRFFKQ